MGGSLWAAASMVIVGVFSLSSGQKWTFVPWFGLVVMSIAGAMSAPWHYSTRAVFSDIFLFAGLPVGAAWALFLKDREKRLFLFAVYCASWLLLALTNLLLVARTCSDRQ